MFPIYPYLNINDLNLDYVLKQIGILETEVTQFVSLNAIKYADPIQWNIVQQYEKNTVVIDPLTGTAYISVAPVPSGVALTNTDYWTVVFDLGSFVTRAAQNFTSHWESETTTTATFPTAMGGWLVWGDVLYKALTNITAGDSYVVNGNIEHFTIENLYNAYLNTIANILAMVGDLADLTTSDTSDIVHAINSVLSDLNVTIGDLNVTIGDLANLNTVDKTNLVNAVNEVLSDVGDVAGDLSQEITDRTNADNALDTKIADSRTYCNVKLYGAKGDGVTDDTQALIDCLAANPIAYLPAGRYMVTDTIEIPDRKGIIGDGKAASVIRGDSSMTNKPVIKGAVNSTHVSLRDLAVEYYGASRTIEPVLFIDCGNVKLISCYFSCIDSVYTFRDCVKFAVDSSNTVKNWSHTVERCTFFKTQLDFDKNTDSQIINNEFNCLELTTAIYLIDGGGYVIADNMIIGEIAVTRSKGVQINNNYFDGGDTHPITSPVGAIKLVQTAHYVQINSNRFFVTVGTPIKFGSGEGVGVDVQIVGNFFQNCDDLLNGLPDIDASGVSAGLIISNNEHIRETYYSGGVRVNRTGTETTNAPVILPALGTGEGDTRALVNGNLVRFSTTYNAVASNGAKLVNNTPLTLWKSALNVDHGTKTNVAFSIPADSAYSNKIVVYFNTAFVVLPAVSITKRYCNYAPYCDIVIDNVTGAGFEFRVLRYAVDSTVMSGTIDFDWLAAVDI